MRYDLIEDTIKGRILFYASFPAFFALPFLLILSKPISFPFADDWLVIGWSSGEKSIVGSNVLQTVNGHQIVISKILMSLLGKLSAYNIQFISLSSFILGFIGISMMVYSQLKFLDQKKSMLITVTCLIIGSNYKQMQNYFMPICNGWMVAMFFIGCYYLLKQKSLTRMHTSIVSVCIILAPISFGIGAILPVLQLVENLYLIFVKKAKIKSHQILMTSSATLVSFTAIIFSKFNSIQDISGVNEKLTLSSLFELFVNPVMSFQFFMSLIGSTFVPSSRFDPILPILAGSLFSTFIIYFVVRNYKKLNLSDFMTNKVCLLGGFIYATMLFIFRNTEQEASLIEIASPRYITGTIILVLGAMILIVKISNSSIQTNIICVAISICILISGIKTGLEWHNLRYDQSMEIMSCLFSGDLTPSKICYKLAKEYSMTPSAEFLNYELNKFVTGVNSGK